MKSEMIAFSLYPMFVLFRSKMGTFRD